MDYIEVKGMKFHSYIGHYDEEKQVGTNFCVDLKVKTDCDKAGKSDKLKDALNYVELFQIVKKQMNLKCNLVENVSYRIINELFENFTEIEKIELKVSKMAPQFGGNVESVCIIKILERKDWENKK
jgi:dihydroneopterin aldolase